MNKNVLIVDCDDRQIQRIERIVRIAARETGHVPGIFKANNVTDADEILQVTDIDTVLLDTVYRGFKQGEYLGFKWVESFRKTKKYFLLPVIFISSLDEPGMMEYACGELHCMEFFPRNFPSDQLLELMRTVMRYTTRRDEENYVLPRNYGMYYPMRVKEILFAQIHNKLLYIHKQEGRVLEIMHTNLSQLMEMAKSGCIIQCNKNTVVNKKYVSKVDLKKHYLLINGSDEPIKIGRVYEEEIRKKFLMKNCDCKDFT